MQCNAFRDRKKFTTEVKETEAANRMPLDGRKSFGGSVKDVNDMFSIHDNEQLKS